jgi:hypothetical protein
MQIHFAGGGQGWKHNPGQFGLRIVLPNFNYWDYGATKSYNWYP